MPPPERIEGSWGIEPVPERLRVLELLDTSPLFAVLLADWLAAGRHYSAEDVFGAPAWRPGLIAAWVAGFALYQWLFPTGPSWWVEFVERLDPQAWEIGATVASFLVSFVVASVVAVLSRRRSAAGAAPA